MYAIQRLQGVLPVNPAGLPGVPAFLAFNTAVSFVSNTNWQSYGGETTMSHLTQMLALTVQNFVSAAVGMAVLAAFIRGLHRRTRVHARQRLGGYDPRGALRVAPARGGPRRCCSCRRAWCRPWRRPGR